MTNLEVIRPFIERFITAVSNSLRLEMAIFDGSCQLFYCTPTYSKKKGRSVHTPSLQEVIANGSILINTPGEMASCIGCRFRDHCPSTIEILCCIHAGTEVAGVLAFTSFTKEGQKRITENNTIYLNAITEMANLFGSQLESITSGQGPANLDASILPVMELCDQPVLLTDAHGVILQYNQLAEDLLKVCELTSASLWQIFPNSVVKRIMEGNDLFEKSVTIGGMATKISTRAIKTSGQITGFYIRISDQLRALSKDTSYFEGIIGTSPAISEVQRMIRRIADSPTPVLITGETGTGKELIARAIHEQSRRSKYPFVAINCSSIPDNLFESELFGYEEGSFTGAKKGGKIGKIEMAQGGTLFLDEIGEMPLFAQPKLLRILQEYELERVGSNKKIHLDIRVIAATNRDLGEMVTEKTFRGDLYYRINVINLKLPPLRTRRDDIIPISENYIKKLKLKMDTSLSSISPEARQLLLDYEWPGNVRQLQNVIEYAANLCETDVLMPGDLPETMHGERISSLPPVSPFPASQDSRDQELLELFDKYGYTLEGKNGSPTSCTSASGPCTAASAASKKNCQKIDWISNPSQFFGTKMANNIYSVTSVNLCQSPSKNSPLFYPSSTDICFSYKMRHFYQYSLCLPCFFVHFL